MKAKYFIISFEHLDIEKNEWHKKEKIKVYTTYLDQVYRRLKFGYIKNLIITGSENILINKNK